MWAGLQKRVESCLKQPTLGTLDTPGSAAALWGRAEVEFQAAACNRDRLRSGPGVGRALERGGQEPAGYLVKELASPSNLSERAR